MLRLEDVDFALEVVCASRPKKREFSKKLKSGSSMVSGAVWFVDAFDA